ncbi:hypothetical protein CHUAL_001571 [Chamberlinius hualienensis]
MKMVNFFIINKLLLPAKCHYFAFFGAMAGVLPFLVRIAMQFGASPSVVGYMYSSIPFIVLFAKGIFGAIADKYQQKKSILIGSVIIMVSGFFVIDFIPSSWDNGDFKVLNNSLRCINYGNENSSVWCWPNSVVFARVNSSSELMEDNCHLTCRTKHEFFRDQLCQNISNNCSVSEGGNSYNFTTSVFINFNATFNSCSKIHFKTINSVSTDLCSNVDHIESCELNCDQFNLHQQFSTPEKFNYRIISLWLCMIFAYIGMGVGVSIGDTIILDLLEKKQNFGRERLWGAVGWGLLSVLAGKLVDWYSPDEEYLNFTPGMYVCLTFGIMDVIIILLMKVIKTAKPQKIVKDVGSLFLEPEVAVFTFGVFIVGCLTSVLWTFLIVYLNELGASQFLIGLTIAFQCFLGEIPFFFVSNWFLKKLGHGHSLTLVLVVFSLRLIAYSLINDPWLVLPIELTQGITFGVFFTALATYANSRANPSIQSTVQGILQGMFEGFGIGVGTVVSGIAYEYFGAKNFFLFTGILAGGLAFMIGTIQYYLVTNRRNKSGYEVKDVDELGTNDNAVEMSKISHTGAEFSNLLSDKVADS